MTTTLKFEKGVSKEIAKLIGAPLKHTKDFFNILGLQVDQAAKLVFRTEGASGGSPWQRFSDRTLHPSWKVKSGEVHMNKTKWNIRSGTDGSKSRRYDGKNLLRASGGFRNSFGILKATNKFLKYGSNMRPKKLVENIMSNPIRNVLFVTPQNLAHYNRIWVKWYSMNMPI